ncbi:MAG TPA: YggS family pyridoxal phosphate-dependent enzyme [Actinomycetota bacterium]|nr:YggS family pyridoxal phosphate-dependent enzyme [Actinomycetota bacterium]
MSTGVVESAGPERGLDEVRQRIARACERAGRRTEEVRLIGITKLVPPELVRRASAAGLGDFGENYAQELAAKRAAAPGATWHYVGRLQRNKVTAVLDGADVVQTLEPGAAARRLARLAAERGSAVRCLVEVDFTGHRVGARPEEVDGFVEDLAAEPGLRIEGLMTVAPLEGPARRWFARLRELRDGLRRRFGGVRELSMGMSADYEDAVEEGATMVRVGTALFGPRR